MRLMGLTHLVGFLVLVMLVGCESTPTKTRGGSVSLDQVAPSDLQLYQQALRYLIDSEPGRAEKGLRQLRRKYPAVMEVNFNLALAHSQQHKFAQAEEVLAVVLRDAPNTAPAHNLAGFIAMSEGQFHEAQQHYQKAIDIEPGYANALYNMALLHDVYLQNIEVAVDFYTRYLAQVEGDSETEDWIQHLRFSMKN